MEPHPLTGSPGTLEDLWARSFLTFPITVTSLHSPGETPDSKTPVGLMKATPFVVRPSYSPLNDDQVGAMAFGGKGKVKIGKGEREEGGEGRGRRGGRRGRGREGEGEGGGGGGRRGRGREEREEGEGGGGREEGGRRGEVEGGGILIILQRGVFCCLCRKQQHKGGQCKEVPCHTVSCRRILILCYCSCKPWYRLQSLPSPRQPSQWLSQQIVQSTLLI